MAGRLVDGHDGRRDAVCRWLSAARGPGGGGGRTGQGPRRPHSRRRWWPTVQPAMVAANRNLVRCWRPRTGSESTPLRSWIRGRLTKQMWRWMCRRCSDYYTDVTQALAQLAALAGDPAGCRFPHQLQRPRQCGHHAQHPHHQLGIRFELGVGNVGNLKCGAGNSGFGNIGLGN